MNRNPEDKSSLLIQHETGSDVGYPPENILQSHPGLDTTRLERSAAIHRSLEPDTTMRLYLRPAGDGSDQFIAQMPSGLTVLAEPNRDGQLDVRISGSQRDAWVPILLFESTRLCSHGYLLRARKTRKHQDSRSFAMAAGGETKPTFNHCGKIRAGYIYELVGNRTAANLALTLFAPEQQKAPKAIQLRLRSSKENRWDYYFVHHRVPSPEVQHTEVSAGSLPTNFRKLWKSLEERSLMARVLKTVFDCPHDTQPTDWLSVVVYPNRIAEYLPQPGRGFLIDQVGDSDFVTTCRYRHSLNSKDEPESRRGFFVTLGRRKELETAVAEIATQSPSKLHIKPSITDHQLREDIRQATTDRQLDLIRKGFPNVLLTNDQNGKVPYGQTVINSVVSDHFRAEKRRRRQELMNNDQLLASAKHGNLAIENDPSDALTRLEAYNSAIDTLEATVSENQMNALLHHYRADVTLKEAALAYDMPDGSLRAAKYRFLQKFCER